MHEQYHMCVNMHKGFRGSAYPVKCICKYVDGCECGPEERRLECFEWHHDGFWGFLFGRGYNASKLC